MNKAIFIIAILFTLCLQSFINAQPLGELELPNDSTEIDSLEYELLITDIGFESYLATQPPMEFYSKHYYRNWNRQYVLEWNIRYRSGPGSVIFENEINYDPFVDYDLELEYTLYYYFLFFEKTNNISLVSRGRR